MLNSCSDDNMLPRTEEAPSNNKEVPSDNQGGENPNLMTDSGKIKEYLRSLPVAKGLVPAGLTIEPNDGMPIPVDNEEESLIDGRGVLDGVPGYWVKNTRRYKVTQTFDENILFDPTVDMIYPGCVLRGNSIADGTYSMISDYRTGDVTFSISLVPSDPSNADETTATVPNIRKSEYQRVWNKWANMDFKESPVVTIQSVDKINSQTELIAKLGAAVKSPIADGSLNLGFNFDKKKNHILARLIQKSFSVSTDVPKSGIIFESIDTKYLDGYQPVYVSNINYGRIIYLSIDTDETTKEVNEAIEFALKKIKGTDIDVSAEQALTYRNILARSDIRITMLGGGKTIQHEVLRGDLDGFQKFLAADIPMEQMHPISFSLRYAVDNSQARVVTSNEFTITQRDFVQDFSKVRMTFRVFGFSGLNEGPFPNLDKKANIWGRVAVTVGGKQYELLNINQKNNFSFNYRQKPEQIHEYMSGGYVIVDFKRGEGEDIQDFIDRQKLSFSTDLHTSNGIYKYNYGLTTFDHTLGTVYSIFKSSNPVVKLESRYKSIKINTYVQLVDMKFSDK